MLEVGGCEEQKVDRACCSGDRCEAFSSFSSALVKRGLVTNGIETCGAHEGQSQGAGAAGS